MFVIENSGMRMDFEFLEEEQKPLVLVVEDDPITRQLHQGILGKENRIEAVESGADALQVLAELMPDAIVLDVEMPGIDGFETCRRIREESNLPIIVVTAHNSLESQLEAFEAGANDIVHKPVNSSLLLRKVALAINTHQSYQRLQQERNSLQSMAMNFLASVGETGTLLNFLRTSIQCRSHIDLAQRMSETAQGLGMHCFGVIRTSNGNHYFRSDGEPSSLEKSVLEKVSQMGRIFQFKSQLVVNYDHVSLIATNVPSNDAEVAGKFKDNLCILAETAESLTENVEMRKASIARAEQLQIALLGAAKAVENLRSEHRQMMNDTRVLLQDLINSVESSFSWLGATTDQEHAINNMMNQSVQNVLDLLATKGQFESEFRALLDSLGGGANKENDLELF